MSRAKILIVEDNELIIQDLERILVRRGFALAGNAATLEEAVLLVEDCAPDLVLLDITLEGRLDGPETLGMIHACHDVPIICLCPAYIDDVTMERARLSEPYGYLFEPFNEREVQLTVEAAFHRHRLEQKLRQSEARYRAVVEEQTELICRFRPDGMLTFVNSAYAQWFGREPENLIGENFLQFVPEPERGAIRDHLTSLSSETPVLTCEHQVKAPDGTMRWQQWTDRGIFDSQRNMIEVQSVGRDVTELKSRSS